MVGKILSYVAVVGLLVALIGGAAYILWSPQDVEAYAGGGWGANNAAGRGNGVATGTEAGAYGRGAAGNAGAGAHGAAGNAAAGEHGAETPLWETLPASSLSAEEEAGLLYMREEEKLARDVYQTLYETWGIESFASIARSEQTHMDTVLALLERYGLSDPVADKGVGEFSDPTLQALYTELVTRGKTSAQEALTVGAYIEEVDIADLKARLAQTDNADIQQVYKSLEQGSVNHLRAFTRVLEWQFGVTYTPQVLSMETYQSLVQTGATPGAVRGRGRWGK